MKTETPAVVFDVGNVLLRWDPRNLYRKVFDDDAAMERFLGEICTMDWHKEQDRGRTCAEATDALLASHPQWETEIRAFYDRWDEMFGGAILENVAVLEDLRRAGVRTYAITNYPTEQFRRAREQYPFLNGFDGVLVSGECGFVKPDPAIFELFLNRFGLSPAACVFIDDLKHNIDAAQAVGMRGIHYIAPFDLVRALSDLGLPVR